ncbi:MAG: hypothetical protein M0P64_04210 [Candidatus Pacebacteria bacterium]|jgi:hypothetical protein|nr:hypothetical protein [Candidatus Paceibacterota bacterium]
MSDDTKSKIADLEKELYSKDFQSHRVEDVLPHHEVAEVPTWEPDEPAPLPPSEEAILKRHLMMKKFVKFSAGFFGIAVLVSAFIWWRGANIVSGENIIVDIAAPVSAAGGDPFETKFTIINNNKVAVEAATLFVEFPVGFYMAPSKVDLPRISKDLGSLAPGQSITETINTLLYGEESTSREVAVTLEYRMASSNATLKKTTTYAIRISSSPINIKLSMPKEVSSGQEIEFSIDLASNSKDPLGALVVDAIYPSGFVFQGAEPMPSYGENTWKIAGLAPQEKKTIKVRGVVEGQESEEKVTKISIGTESLKDERYIGVVYNAATESSIITKPFLALDLAVNGNKGQDTVASLNKGVRVDVFWQSNNPTKVTDAVVEVKLKGAALDKYSLYASGGGFYRSVDNTIVWDKTGNQELAVIEPGTRGTVSFSFSPVALGVDAGRLVKNPQIIFEVRARAGRMSDVSASEDIMTFVTRNVKFETELKLGATGLYFSGPFQNSGPIPPQADRETTYTISLTARNSANNVSNTYVKTTLPIYTKWLGKVYPEGEDIMFNEGTGEVTWNVGRIPAGGSRDASFQISFLPSVSHINRAPFLTGEISAVATDDFTKSEVRDKKPALTTYISGDPQFTPNDANVVN